MAAPWDSYRGGLSIRQCESNPSLIAIKHTMSSSTAKRRHATCWVVDVD